MDVIISNSSEKVITVSRAMTVIELLNYLHLNTEAYIVLRDKVPVPDDELLHNTDTVQVLRVLSGG